MLKSKQDIITKIHLIISVLVVVSVAFVYGFNPSSKFDIYLGSIDGQNFFKATMGLYLSFSALWVLGIFNIEYLRLALITNIVFMFGLACGRLVSLLIDGIPTSVYIFGIVGEFILGFYGLWVIKFYTIPLTNSSK